MTNFPLIQKWFPGLIGDGYLSYNGSGYIRADCLEERLDKNKRVTSFGDAGSWMTQEAHPYFARGERLPVEALLIGIQPIKQETAEDLLREIISERDKHQTLGIGLISDSVIQKVRTFLEKSK